MERKIIAFLLAFCLLLAVLPAPAGAAAKVYFTAVNETLYPLSDGSMPFISGGAAYVPYTVFTGSSIGVFLAQNTDGTLIMLYNSSSGIFFDLSAGTSYDQDNSPLPSGAVRRNGTIYIPAKQTASALGLSCSYISSDIAPVVRIRSSASIFTDHQFITYIRSTMNSYMSDYTATLPPEEPDGGEVAPPPVAPEEPEEPTYENVTVFLSFTDIDPEFAPDILEILERYRYSACFFMTEEDIRQNPDLTRRLIGSGHAVGIRLADGTESEFSAGTRALFGAAYATTVIAAASSETDTSALLEKGTIVWSLDSSVYGSGRTRAYHVTNALSTTPGGRNNVIFACSENTVNILPSIISHLREYSYSVGSIDELTTPARDI